MKRLGGLLLAAAALAPAQLPNPRVARGGVVALAQVPGPRVARGGVVALEQAFDNKIRKIHATDPFDLLSSTQGAYVDGIGVVFTTQVDLILTPGTSMFRPVMSKADLEKIRGRKVTRLPELKKIMREMLVEAAAAMTSMPPGEQVVVAVSLFRMSWEDSTGLPSQVIMHAPRQKLLDRNRADSAIQIQEY